MNSVTDKKVVPKVTPNLGIVYTSNFLKKALETKPTLKDITQKLVDGTKPKIKVGNYTLVGLLFKKIVEKEFKVEALFFNKRATDAFTSVVLEQTTLPSFISDDNVSTGKQLKIDQLEESKSEDQSRIRSESRLQFWDVMNRPENSHISPFVYFSRNQLELLLSGAEHLVFSGAKIDYGVGRHNFEEQAVDPRNKSAYPTLKAECNLERKNKDQYIPNVALAIPCPTMWPDASLDTRGLNRTLSDSRFFFEIDQNYELYKENEAVRSPLQGTQDVTINIKSTMDSWISYLEKND